MTTVPTIPLATLCGEKELPLMGYGSFGVTDADVFAQVLEVGYPLVDTSPAYGNEAVIGDVINSRCTAGAMKRDDVFVTSKVAAIHMGSMEYVKMGIEGSLHALQLDHIDLCLFQMPMGFKHPGISAQELASAKGSKALKYCYPFTSDGKPDFAHHDLVQTWKALEHFVEEGVINAIGVSNFNLKQLDRVRNAARVPVANLQMELHAYLSEEKLVSTCQENGITVTSYGSLAAPGYSGYTAGSSTDEPNPLKDPVILDIASKYGKTPAQVLLRNLTQRNIAVIPKSSTPSRIKENCQIFEFTLSEGEMAAIAALNRDLRMLPMTVFKDHPEYPW